MIRRSFIAVALPLLIAGSPALAQGWTSMAAADGVTQAGTLVDDALAGLRFECAAGGPVRTIVSHNGVRFDRARAHTVVLSVDGLATVLTMTARDSARPGDDDLGRDDPGAAVRPLIDALASGSDLEVSAPSGRYRLSLSGSSRALSALRAACGF